MDQQNLVKMANQIGTFFESDPDQQQAAKDIANHLKKFWESRMRKAIIGYMDQGGNDLKPIVQTAIQNHRQMLS
jgi:formate dehydrogenase subunit delta